MTGGVEEPDARGGREEKRRERERERGEGGHRGNERDKFRMREGKRRTDKGGKEEGLVEQELHEGGGRRGGWRR